MVGWYDFTIGERRERGWGEGLKEGTCYARFAWLYETIST